MPSQRPTAAIHPVTDASDGSSHDSPHAGLCAGASRKQVTANALLRASVSPRNIPLSLHEAKRRISGSRFISHSQLSNGNESVKVSSQHFALWKSMSPLQNAYSRAAHHILPLLHFYPIMILNLLSNNYPTFYFIK